MPERLSYLIIGNGIAGATAAEILRSEDAAADITLVADDPFPVYYRPALKDYLGGKVREDKLWARPMDFYQERGIRFLTDRVMSIHPAEHSVRLQSGQKIAYTRLLLANGARASTLRCPGMHLNGVTTLRTVADYQSVLSRLGTVHRVVVTGSGTLALETIETLRHRGYQVTHLLRRRTLWSDILDPVASDLVLQEEKRDGVDVRIEQEVAEITGDNGQVSGVITTTGAHIPCELVVIAIGIDPVVDFLKESGIACGRGVRVDGAMRTNVPDVYAAGDVIETSDPVTGRTRVIGQWYPSVQQARAAAYSMLDLLDTKHEFRFGNFYNATFLYGLDFASVGLSNIPGEGQGYQVIVADPLPRTYQKVVLKDGVPVGVIAIGDRKSVLTLKRAIDHRVNLSAIASRLFAPDFRLAGWLDSQNVPGPLLGVNREGAVAVRSMAYTDSRSRSVLLPALPPTQAVLLPETSSELAAHLGITRLSRTKVTAIGRQEGIALFIPHGSISRRHAEISYANEHYVLRDLGSTNGTAVNNVRLEANGTCMLKPGDRVRFGQVPFVFQVQKAGVQQAPAQGKNGAASVVQPEQVNGAGEPGTVRIDKNHALLALPKTDQTTGVSRLPTLSADGSLILPHGAGPVPSAVVATLRNAPALVIVGKDKPQAFPVKRGKHTFIGREKANDISLSDASVSRRHAEVYADQDGYYIRDLDSSNGVLVNQVRISNPNRLSHGDRVVIGSLVLYFIHLPASQDGEKEQPTRVCLQCGASNDRAARFCAKCGAPFQGE